MRLNADDSITSATAVILLTRPNILLLLSTSTTVAVKDGTLIDELCRNLETEYKLKRISKCRTLGNSYHLIQMVVNQDTPKVN